MRARRTRRAGLLRTAVAVLLGFPHRREAAPPRAPWRDRSASALEAPMPAEHPLQFGRAYQLPPSGRGNGIEALFWTPAQRLPAERVDAVLAALRDHDIAAWVAPARLPGVDHRAADAPHDLWVASTRSDDALDVVMRALRER
jgi:hypothetical protein